LIAFVFCLACAIWVLLPHALVFAFRGEALLEISDQEGVEHVAEAYRAAGIWGSSLTSIPTARRSPSDRAGSRPAASCSPSK
jgi:hypothetical protein